MIELTHLRDEFTKTWLTQANDDGTEERFMRRFTVPVHYMLDGRWVDIEPRWVKTWYGYQLTGVGYDARIFGSLVGAWGAGFFLGAFAKPTMLDEGRVSWRIGNIEVLVNPTGWRLQLHVLYHGRETRPLTFVTRHLSEQAGKDNINRVQARSGAVQRYHLELRTERAGVIVRRWWTGRVAATDVHRRRTWSHDAVFPARMVVS